jgi:hypothetical protein
MSNHKPKVDDRQMGLFVAVHLEPKTPPGPGSMNISARLRMAVGNAIHKSGKPIQIICAEIYELTGEEVSIHSMRKWSAPSTDFAGHCEDLNSNKRWGIPAEISPAFCQVTGDWEVLFIQAAAGNFKALKGKEVVHARMGLLKEEINRKSHELKELEKALVDTKQEG